MVMVVPLQLNPRFRVSTCHVMVVPAVVIASVADRVNVNAAAGVSIRSKISVRRPLAARLVRNEFNLYLLPSLTINRDLYPVDFLRYHPGAGVQTD